MRTVIKVESLSKRFRIGKLRQDEGTLRDVIGNLLKYPFRDRAAQEQAESLWALRDVSFEVRQGETFGIIGGNGAGKSTLLKILSRIIKPSSGRAVLDGRVGSLLEIGTGFHPDLTGRENIFLNGAVLGMRRREVEKNFDEIVAFSDLEKFLETPVKFYSSGMFARLAFAVAAHLEPEILIVDEVLAVGDAAFQAKCLGKMGKVAEGGRTVLFVSHDASSVLKLCRSGMYLEKGRIKALGNINDVMASYKSDYEPEVAAVAREEMSRNPPDIKAGESRFVRWDIIDSRAKIPHGVYAREKAVFEFVFISKRAREGAAAVENVSFRFTIQDAEHRPVISDRNAAEIKPGVNRLYWSCNLPLKADSYKLFAEAYSPEDHIVLDAWQCEPELTVLSDEAPPDPSEIQGLISVPTSFGIVHE